MTPAPIPEGVAPVADRVLGFSVGARNVRGRVVRLDAALNAVLAAHDYPSPLATVLGEALVLTALLGATLREDEGQLTLQAQSKGGPVDLLVCDYRAGAVRGYLRHDGSDVAPGLDLHTLFGEGHLAITLDPTAAAERYQGIVPLEGASLAEAAEGYFANSEQLPTLIRLAVRWDATTGWVGGGLLVQHLARSEIGGERLSVADMNPDWQHVLALASTMSDDELTDLSLSEETLIWRLFHDEEVRVVPGPVPTRGCRCTLAHIKDVLSSFPPEERAEMAGDDGRIKVDCAFCARVFAVDV
ncbi:Hsp33 family molecular chaperone HslO [Polymorphobacter sp. PAMC 29334]|uniref:Hsp33 family molecular chaperone HslO n=1 Tax=Polymorphobacter sp. PAMC 29334 TaxID=2862331 RepID=UPI001C77B439|nr:Hsp33 family molecular chaperone HslO [Polymorphobacter sp. PAMC 29334]QYE35181.1 Hsp33 family molecular chaperone HslO [Polymorphobacter sp. PAMC 29334]